MGDYRISPLGVHESTEDSSVAATTEGYRWVDVENPDGQVRTLLEDDVGLVSELVDDALEICLIPKVHRHNDHLLLVTHALDEAGHLLGLHLVLGPTALVSLHLKMNKEVDEDESVVESRRVLEELRVDPSTAPSPGRLALRLVSALTDKLEVLLMAVAQRAGRMDRDMREGKQANDEELLEPLFAIRHDLVTVQIRLDQTGELVESALDLAPEILDDVEGWGALHKRLVKLSRHSRGERDFFDGVLGLYEQRINVKMNFAMERLALITAVLLPVTAVAGIVGMNTISTRETNLLHTALWLALMAALAVTLLYWARRRGWW